MMSIDEFKQAGHQIVDWIASYYENIEQLPVKANVTPGQIYQQINNSPPEIGEDFSTLFEDFKDIILPGMTNWQHPNFHAYFPANASFPSICAEMLTAALAAQCMIWETSPAAAELEEKMMEWLRDMMGLSKDFVGVINDTASTATLTAILTAREVHTNYAANENGVPSGLRIYCSTETHSSIEKAVKIAGIGRQNLVKIKVDDNLAMDPFDLEEKIEADIATGLQPICVVSALGTTGTVAIDPIDEISKICIRHGIWHHVDAAYAGSVLILPEYRHLAQGVEQADSFVVNPHKWLFTNFDCTAYYVKDVDALLKTFEILPEYLKTTSRGEVNDYRDWGIPLGRRFRALKLWFVIRSFGESGLRKKIREHIQLNRMFSENLGAHFELMLPPSLNASVFRYRPHDNLTNSELNIMNEELKNKLNASGKMYLTHTKINDAYALRFVVGQTNVEKRHVNQAIEIIKETAESIL